MRHRRPGRTFACFAATAALALVAGCSDDEPALRDALVEAGDLSGFDVSDAEVDDTLTSFCANEDATSGLQASEREVIGFEREGGGASVIQLAFRFEEGGAATFVQQADAALSRCSGVPDLTGLAFEYEPLSPDLAKLVEGAGDDRTARYGTSVGSGNLTIDVLVAHRGDVGMLVAVLGLDVPRAELDAIADDAFSAAVDRL